MMKYIPHPTVQIIIWVMLALLVQGLQGMALLCSCVLAIGLSLCCSAAKLLSLLHRTRWIVISLLLIYAYTTAGSAVWTSLGLLSPTWEGLHDGMTQLGRLLSVLAGLAILLTLLSQAQLISGLYVAMYPLSWMGVSRERFAVRLALTLQSAELVMQETADDWRAAIGGAMEPTRTAETKFELELHSFKLIDVCVLIVGLAVLIGVWR